MLPTPVILKSLTSAASSVVGHLSSAQSSSTCPSTPVSTSSTTSLNLADYDANSTTGFVPAEPQLLRLPAPFDAWERSLDLVNCPSHESVLSLGEDSSAEALTKRVSSEAWRQDLRRLPVLSIESFEEDVLFLRRAHHVLAYLVHFYIHSIPPTSPSTSTTLGPVIPASLSIPLVETSKVLGMAPILTYADTVLWNIAPRDTSKPLARGNIRILTTFSGTSDEENFYECCANVELFGAESLALMASYERLSLSQREVSHQFSSSCRGVRVDCLRSVAGGLDQLTSNIDDMTTLMKGCHGTVGPKVFYDQIRPWFCGSSSGSQSWVYEGADMGAFAQEWHNLAGPSGGQSTTMHALDVFLDVDHSIEKLDDRRTSVEARPGNDRLFMRRMQKYMPQAQRAFLARIGSHPTPPSCPSDTLSVRQLVVALSSTSNSPAAHEVVGKYNGAVAALRRFRDAHLKIACVYIVAQARKAAVEAGTLEESPKMCPVGAMMKRLAAEGDSDLLAVCPISKLNLKGDPSGSEKKEAIRGTGGTELVCLLRSCRDATTRAIIPTNASR